VCYSYSDNVFLVLFNETARRIKLLTEPWKIDHNKTRYVIFHHPILKESVCIYEPDWLQKKEEMIEDNIYIVEMLFDWGLDVHPYNEYDLIKFFSNTFKIEHTIEPEHNHTEPNDNDDNEPIPQINEDDNRIAPGPDYYEMLNPEIGILDEPDDTPLAINREHLDYDFDDDDELNPDPVDEEQISDIISSINFNKIISIIYFWTR
jgi:hypothetical protein